MTSWIVIIRRFLVVGWCYGSALAVKRSIMMLGRKSIITCSSLSSECNRMHKIRATTEEWAATEEVGLALYTRIDWGGVSSGNISRVCLVVTALGACSVCVGSLVTFCRACCSRQLRSGRRADSGRTARPSSSVSRALLGNFEVLPSPQTCSSLNGAFSNLSRAWLLLKKLMDLYSYSYFVHIIFCMS